MLRFRDLTNCIPFYLHIALGDTGRLLRRGAAVLRYILDAAGTVSLAHSQGASRSKLSELSLRICKATKAIKVLDRDLLRCVSGIDGKVMPTVTANEDLRQLGSALFKVVYNPTNVSKMAKGLEKCGQSSWRQARTNYHQEKQSSTASHSRFGQETRLRYTHFRLDAISQQTEQKNAKSFDTSWRIPPFNVLHGSRPVGSSDWYAWFVISRA